MKPPIAAVADESAPASASPRSLAARLHHALMPDYNRNATVYWWTVVLLGAAALGFSTLQLLALPPSIWLQAAVGVAIAMAAGFFPVRVPNSTNSFAAGEIFIFLLLLLHGPAVATLAAAGEGLIGSLRTSSRWTSRIVSPAMAALAMLASGTLLHALLDVMTLYGLDNAGLLIVVTMVFALVYFALNTLLVSTLPHLKRNEPLQLADLLGMFGWVGIAFAGSAAVASLLFLTFKESGIGVLMAIGPILAMLLATLHYHYRQQETNESVRLAASQAAEQAAQLAAQAVSREADLASRHLHELQASERRFQSAFTHASIGMALLSFEGRILQANAALRALLGVDEADLRQHDFQAYVAEADLIALNVQLAQVNQRDFEAFAIELRCRHSSGSQAWVAANCSFFSEPGSTTPCLILQAQDISARREAEAGLHRLAFHDALTGLPNRRRFGELLSQAVQEAQANKDAGYAVMFLDFDRFKLINDSLGHSAGDEFLVLVSQRIAQQLRPADIVARLGGDEFAVLARVQFMHGDQEVIALADRLIESLKRPFQVANTELNTSASIGVTSSQFGYSRPEDVLRDADIAMYRAKAAGKARYALFDARLHEAAAQRLQLESELRRAIDQRLLSVAYQPLYNLADGRPTGFEALARWNHPLRGAISPDVFIPIAEESGLIVALTDFMLHSACQQLRQWQLSDPAYAELSVHVNIAGKDLAQPGFVARVTHAIVEARLQPQHLALELTENILMAQLATALPLLEEVRKLGVSLSVDDFGTGYSSLAHLSTLPIDSLKIDRSFVSDLQPDTKASTVVRAIAQLGNALGKKVIAEGIETAEQLEQLRDMGCQSGQGFHLSRPLTPAAVELLLSRRLAEPSKPAASAESAPPAAPARSAAVSSALWH